MCGFCGFTGKCESPSEIIELMTDMLVHRGPDSAGYFADKDISMGFRRLSIVDLGGGNQPIYSEDNNLVLNFNGEIYNYKELKDELLNLGHKFYTESDSEVLLHSYEEWGEDFLIYLRGMFTFAIWNRREKSLFMARDFFGIKPLYYSVCGENFLYASEIKSIISFPTFEKKLNLKMLDNYLSFQYALPPETFFEGVFNLMPGHFLKWKDGEFEIKKYFEAKFEPDKKMDLKEATEKIEKVFEDSVRAHRIADVECGCFLSSGVDSSYVASYFADQKAFSVGFDFGEKYNEAMLAKKLATKLGIEHHHKIISAEEFWGAVKHTQYFMDQPLADPSCVALYFVSKLASNYVKVVLSGEGADEIFGGYRIYKEPGSLEVYQKYLSKKIRVFLSDMVKKIPKNFKGKNFIIRGAKSLEERFIGNAFMFTKEEKARILADSSLASHPQEKCKLFYEKAEKEGYDDVTKMQYIDMNFWLIGDILLKADRMSMANAIELRVPFLDIEVWKLASKLPTNLKVSKEKTKIALRAAASKRLPSETAEKEKLGFPVPIRVWLKDKQYYTVVKAMFCSEIAAKFFCTDEIVSLLDNHLSGKVDNSRKIWTIYMFLIWYEIYFLDDKD